MISFENTSLLSYEHRPIFLGDDIFNYSIEKNIKIQGFLLDLENFVGVSGVISGINVIKNLAKNTGEFVLNNQYLGTGYIENITIDGDQSDPNWVRYANYEASIKIFSTGSLHNMTGAFYDLDNSKFNVSNLYLVNNFNENYSINLNQEGLYEYSHQFGFEFENGIAKNIAQSIAKNLASGLVSTEVPFKLLSPYGANFLDGKKIHKETYDIINNKFDFSETFAKSKSGDYADALYSYDVVYDQDGSVSVSELVKIKSLELPLFDKSIDKLYSLRSGAYSRCQNVYYDYYQNIGELNINSVESGLVINKFNGEVQYQTTFSNNEFIENQYEWEFISEAIDNQENINIITKLNIVGHGAKNSIQKWNNALHGFNQKKHFLNNGSVRHEIFSMLGAALGKCRGGQPNFFVSQKASASYYDGTISQSNIYSDIEGKTVTTSQYEAPVRQFSMYPTAGGVRTIEHPQKSIGRSTVSTTTLNENLGTSLPSAPGSSELTESASTIHDLFNRTVQTRITNYVH